MSLMAWWEHPGNEAEGEGGGMQNVGFLIFT